MINQYCSQRMSSSQLARKRLMSLKLLTEELKDQTRQAPFDLTHIKQILNSSKQLHTSNSHKPPLPDIGMQSEDINVIDSNYKPLFGKKQLGKDEFSFEEEVVKLRQENVALEQTIVNLKDSISQLEHEKATLQKAQQSSNTNYFKLSEHLEGFVGRLSLPSDSYDRLQYSTYEVQLKLDKISLFRKQKSSLQQFELGSLKQADYCSGNVFVLRFQEFMDEQRKNLTSVFLKFVSEEHLHKWDLALFANYHIVNSLSESRLFQKYFRCLKVERELESQKQQIKMIKDSQQLEPSKQKDLLKLLIQKRQEYLQVKKLLDLKIQQKLKSSIALNKEELQYIEPKPQPIVQPKNSQPPQSSKKANISSPIQKIEELEPHQQESQQIIQPLSHANNKLQIKHTQLNTLNIKQFPNNQTSFNYSNSNVSNSSFKPLASQKIGNSSAKGNFPLSPPPLVPNTVAQSQLRQSKASIVNQLNVQGRTISYESSQRNNSASKFKQMGQDKLNNARMRLQSGYYATKYSKDGFSPHEKKVFLSLDCRKLCWSQRDKSSEYKSVPIAVVIGVTYGVVGEGITKHVKDPDARYFCVIEYYTSDYKKKTIELGSGNMQDIKDLSSELAIIIQNRQIAN